MTELQQWIDKKLSKIAIDLPIALGLNPAGFSCGHAMGYKQAMLDLERFLYKDDDDNI